MLVGVLGIVLLILVVALRATGDKMAQLDAENKSLRETLYIVKRQRDIAHRSYRDAKQLHVSKDVDAKTGTNNN